MSIDLNLVWAPEISDWVDLLKLVCDFCEESTPWFESNDPEPAEQWEHLLGLDCCPECNAAFYGQRLIK
jgi:hypothetical protein